MTISTTHSYKVFNGNGVTTAFAIDFQFFTSAELLVTLISSAGVETVQTITTHYTVSGGGSTSPATGTVTMVTAPPSGSKLRVERATLATQTSAWGNGDRFSETSLNRALDRIAVRVQEIETDAARAFKQSWQDFSDGSGAEINFPTPEAGKYIGWNDDGDGLENLDGIEINDFTELTGSNLANGDFFGLYDVSASANKKISYLELLTKIDMDLGVSAGVADGSITNAKLADMAAWTIKIRNAATSGDASDAAIGDVTSATPDTDDYVMGFLNSGEIRKFQISTLTSSGLAALVNDTSPELGGDLETNGNDIIVENGDAIVTGQNASDVLKIKGYDVDNTTWRDILTVTAGNTVTADLWTSTTIGSAYIYRVSGTDVALADGGTGASLADPNADRIMFWDDSGGSVAWLTAGNGIIIDGTDLKLDVTGLSAPASFGSGDKVIVFESNVAKVVDFDDFPSGIQNVVEDTTPQLGGDLDTNGFNIGIDDNKGITDDSGNEQLWFQKTSSAVNYIEITNAATGNPALLYAQGSDTNVNLEIGGKGTGGVIATLTNTGLHLLDTDASHDLIVSPGSNLSADRTLTITTGDSNRTLTLTADASIGGTAYVAGGTDVALADGGTGASLADPGADRIMFWDDSGSAVTWLSLGSGLTINTTTLDLTVSGLSAPTSFGSGDKLVIFEGGVAKVVDYDDLPGSGGGLSNVVEDLTPQLGGDLDANAFNIGFDDGTGIEDDSGNEQLLFGKTASAVNYVKITNAATAGSPIIEALGDDANVDLLIRGKGTGGVLATFTNTGLHILDTNASHDLIIAPGSNITADRTLTLTTGDADRTVSLSGDLTVGGTSSINGTAYVASGTDVALADGGTGASLTDPNADRIMFWDDSGGAVTWLTATTGLEIDTTSLRMTENQRMGAIVVTLGNGSTVPSTGVAGYVSVPYACTISSVTMVADQSGSMVVDIWVDSYANALPDNSDSITASAPPTLSSAVKSTDTTLTGWDTAIAAGDVIGFNIDSATTVTQVTLTLKVIKT